MSGLNLRAQKEEVMKEAKVLVWLGVILVLVYWSVGETELTCGGNCAVGGKCDLIGCYCGEEVLIASEALVRSLCSMYPWDVEQCVCIANKTSDFNINLINGWVYDNEPTPRADVGLWQVDSVNWFRCGQHLIPRDKLNNHTLPLMCDPYINVKCAFSVWQEVSSFHLWKVCKQCNAC
eukprot:TRINITY_DN2000_c0_g1_i1.p1 TRINITY_DN2000_c0_g1~~TRINITY_DN2000_c0_g1_i1.p1  ORF type:complete len:178 (+),score=22.07 TRINITY_DN2000_c0_g1_i1:100-633(+)